MQLFENNAWGTLAATITDAAVSLTLTAGQGARFPSLCPGLCPSLCPSLCPMRCRACMGRF